MTRLAAISPLLDACRDWEVYERERDEAWHRGALDYQEYADRALAAHEAVEAMVDQLTEGAGTDKVRAAVEKVLLDRADSLADLAGRMDAEVPLAGAGLRVAAKHLRAYAEVRLPLMEFEAAS